mmetsp:Transcript_38608/g.129109  ORF Transcript_38608/g.129109 Transcript_38608/m.129109 type:complete len:162 (-) Transcript_38608:143-628(-)
MTWSGAAAAQERASGDEEPLSTEVVSGAWQCLFRQIAMPCNLNSSSEDAIREQVAALVARASSRLRRQLSDNRHTLDPPGHSSGLALRRKASTLWTRVSNSGSTTPASSGTTARYARRCSGAPVAEGREHIEPAQELDRLEEPSSSASDDDGSAGAREGKV